MCPTEPTAVPAGQVTADLIDKRWVLIITWFPIPPFDCFDENTHFRWRVFFAEVSYLWPRVTGQGAE